MRLHIRRKSQSRLRPLKLSRVCRVCVSALHTTLGLHEHASGEIGTYGRVQLKKLRVIWIEFNFKVTRNAAMIRCFMHLLPIRMDSLVLIDRIASVRLFRSFIENLHELRIATETCLSFISVSLSPLMFCFPSHIFSFRSQCHHHHRHGLFICVH